MNNSANILGIKRTVAGRTNAPATPSVFNQAQTKAPKVNTGADNNKNFLEGLGYLGWKVGHGFLSTFEGLWDYSAGGLAKLFGGDAGAKWAEEQFKNDWVDYTRPDTWFQPDEGWKVAGDVASGVGTSLPAIATAVGALALTAATGGAAAPAAIPIAAKAIGSTGIAITALGAAGSGTKEAYQETGELGGKEFGYGALVGATEAAIETVTFGTGSTRAVREIAEVAAKQTSKSLGKSLFVTLGKDALSEAGEEMIAEFMSPIYAKLTYNPDAEMASAGEILYSGFVGGLSGMIMGGGTSIVQGRVNAARGANAAAKGQTAEIMSEAKAWADFAERNNLNDDTYDSIRSTYRELETSLAQTGGEIRTDKQRRLLGKLKYDNTIATFNPMFYKAAVSAIMNADVLAEQYASGTFTDENGNKINVTADAIRGSLGKNNLDGRSIMKELKNNPALRMIVVNDVTGHILMNTQNATNDILTGGSIASSADLNRLLETATPEEIRDLSTELGIDNWESLTPDDFNYKVAEWQAMGGLDSYRAKMEKLARIKDSAVISKTIPRAIALGDGKAKRFKEQGFDLTVYREGDTFTLLDNETGRMSRNLTRSEVNELLRTYDDSKTKTSAEAEKKPSTDRTKTKYQEQAEAYDKLARENIPEYASLSAANKGMVRKTIRQAYANGMSDADVLMLARVSAHSGIDVVVSRNPITEELNGYYDIDTGKMYINPKAKQSASDTVAHEAFHAIIAKLGKTKATERIFKVARDVVPNEVRKDIKRVYSDQKDFVITEEIGAHATLYLNNEAFVRSLVTEKPSLKKTIIDFFKGARTSYAKDGRLSRAARKYLRLYSKLFAEMSGVNTQGQSLEIKMPSARADGEIRASFAGIRATTADKFLLSRAQKMLYEGVDSETVRKETGWFKGYDGKWRFEIDDSDIKISFTGKLSRNAEIRRYSELLEKAYLLNTATESELKELARLDQKYKGKSTIPDKLGDIINHPDLFAAYPELADIDIYFNESVDTASYHPGFKEISLPKRLRMDSKRFKKTLLHEIQHAVQDIEGFASGSNVDMFNNTANHTAYEQYLNTAGEIEARDVSNRSDMTAEQRKNTRPDIDRTDVIIIKDSTVNDNLDENLGEQLDDWLKYGGKKGGKFNGKYFTLGTTPDVFVKHGARHVEMIMYDDVVAKVTGMKGDDAHVIALGEIAKLPSQLNDPILLFKGSIPNSFVALTEITTKQGHDVVVAVHIKKGSESRSEITKIASLYSKTNQYGYNRIIDYVNHQIQEGNLLDASAKKAPTWFTTRGLQLPKAVQTIIDASMISIPETPPKVNPSDEISSKKSSDRRESRVLRTDSEYLAAVERGDMVTAQRMVDEAAKKAGYTYNGMHGTNADFNKFDYSYISDDNKLGLGFYFTNNEKLQFKYDYEKTAYLKFENPIFDNNPILDDILRRESDLRESGLSQKETLKKIQSEFGYDGIIAEYNRRALVAFNPKQIKSADPVTYDDEGNVIPLSQRFNLRNKDIRYSRSLDIYTEEQYNNYGWARANDILNAGQNADYRSKFARAVKGDKSFRKTDLGEWMIPVSDIYDDVYDGIDNVIVFAKGTIDLPEITRVLHIDLYNETELSRKRSEVYALERNGLRQAAGGVFSVYTKADVGDFSNYKRSSTQNVGYNNGLGINGGAGGRKTTRLKEIYFSEDGEVLAEIRASRPLSEAVGEIATSAIAADLTGPRSLGTRAKEWATDKVQELSSMPLSAQIQFVNEQAGIENAAVKMGVERNKIESAVQMVRNSAAQAQYLMAGKQFNLFTDDARLMPVAGGKSLTAIMEQIPEADRDGFQMYLYHAHNVDRMSLEAKSEERLNALIAERDEILARVRELDERLAAETDPEVKRDLRAQRKEANKAYTRAKRAVEGFTLAENKPVLAKTVDGVKVAITAEESAEMVRKYEAERPEFKRVAGELYGFLDNVQRMRVDAGLITKEHYNTLKTMYPHYVPTYRAEDTLGISGVWGKHSLEVKKTVGRAKGSLDDLARIDVSIAHQLMQTVRAANINRVAGILYDAATSGEGNTRYISEASRERVDPTTEETDHSKDLPKNNQITFYRNGERITLDVSAEVFVGFNAFNSESTSANSILKLAEVTNTGFKRLVTSANPFFLIKNAVRDVQDAGINTKYNTNPVKFVANYFKAIREIATNGEYWQRYCALGGINSTVFDTVRGVTGRLNRIGLRQAEKGRPISALLNRIENANVIVEQLPRLMEFIGAIDAGATPSAAVLAAADVTTNFARSGKIGKALNRTIIPFLNPAIQGMSKIYRNVKNAVTAGSAKDIARELIILAVKAAFLGIIPMVLNNMLYEDDEDYKNLRDNDKENNYLLKVGDVFWKLPRGRVAAVLAGLYNRTASQINGNRVDWMEFIDNVLQNVTPVQNFSRTIFSPFTDIATNRTWYGTEIDGQEWDNTRPRNRYDESTSDIAIAIGSILPDSWDVSPKKIHYLLDQYSGIIGDLVLPLTTEKAEGNIIEATFTVDPVTSNRLSSDFYALIEDVRYRNTEGDETAKYQLKYLNSVKKDISEMFDERQKTQQNSDLSDKEKLAEVRVIQALINKAYENAVLNFTEYTKAIESTRGFFDEEKQERERYAEITRRTFGAEKALEDYNEDVYGKATVVHKSSGLSYDDYFVYYFGTKGLKNDTDKQGNTIAGSKKKKVLAVINSLKTSKEQKLMLLATSGYSLADSDKAKLLKYILNSKNLTKAEKEALAKMCGFTVRNGKIIKK